jgi:hypothetical protein
MVTNKLFDLYEWELEFITETIRQRDHRYSVDPQNPPDHFGGVKIIRMIPRQPEWPPLEVAIPLGALPVWHRKVSREAGSMDLKGLQFRVGWRKDGKRTMIAIDAQTKVVTLICDNDPKK